MGLKHKTEPEAAKKDATQELINRIMNEGVPAAGQLIHPLNAAKNEKKKQMNLNDVKKNVGFPSDVKAWTPKLFVDYFAQRYQEVTGANYRRVYKADIKLIQDMGDFLVSNGLERNMWTKKLLDWAMKHREEIVRLEGHFTPQEILRRINHFYQEQVLPQVEQGDIIRDTHDTILLEEIQKADADGRTTEIFNRFGIPVSATYFVKTKGFKEETVIKAVEERIKTLSSGSASDKEDLYKMLHASIVGSPYPSEFYCLDWRDKFSSYIKEHKKETWWRTNDYKGKPLPKYYSLI